MKFPNPSQRVLPDQIKCVRAPDLSESAVINRINGSLVGLAVGDALGASVEFRPHQYFLERPVKDMQGGGTWGLRAGQWTDDTSMALCLASSLIETHGYDPYDQMVRYKWWYKYGYMSSTGNCFDIGNATRDSIEEFIYRQKELAKKLNQKVEEMDSSSDAAVLKKFDVYCSSPGVAGNGALMRLAPVPLFFYRYPELAVEYSGQSGQITHGDQKAYDACRYYGALIVAAVMGFEKEKILDTQFYANHKHWFGGKELQREILRVAQGSYQNSGGYDGGIRGKGYIVNALEAALWAFWSSDSFEKGALAAVNLGDDTDTTAAIYGQLAGAYYGYNKISQEWLNKVYAHDLLVCIGHWLYYEGKQYKPKEKDWKMISSLETTKVSLDDRQPNNYLTTQNDIDVNGLNRHKNYVDYTTNRRSNNELSIPRADYDGSKEYQHHNKNRVFYRSYAYQQPEYDQDTDRSRKSRSDFEQPSSYQSSTNREYDDLSNMYQRSVRQPVVSPAKDQRISTFRSNSHQTEKYITDDNEFSPYESNLYQSPVDHNPHVSQLNIQLKKKPTDTHTRILDSSRQHQIEQELRLQRLNNDSYRLTPTEFHLSTHGRSDLNEFNPRSSINPQTYIAPSYSNQFDTRNSRYSQSVQPTTGSSGRTGRDYGYSSNDITARRFYQYQKRP